jgi:hypothetical protein
MTQTVGDQSEMDKGQKHHIEFLETGEDPAEALESANTIKRSSVISLFLAMLSYNSFLRSANVAWHGRLG